MVLQKNRYKFCIQPSDMALFGELARNFIQIAQVSIAENGSFHVALSGGVTPQTLYQLLGTAPYREQIAWDKVHVYQTDERFVASDHPDNNFSMIQRCLLNAVALPKNNQHRMETENCSPLESSVNYQQEITNSLPCRDGLYQFDYMLLGVGVDGHIASLFPGDKVGFESQDMVFSTYVTHLQSWRISLTLSAINRARHIGVIVVGKQKSSVVASLFNPHLQPIYPVHYLTSQPSIVWYLDEAAACSLQHEALV